MNLTSTIFIKLSLALILILGIDIATAIQLGATPPVQTKLTLR